MDWSNILKLLTSDGFGTTLKAGAGLWQAYNSNRLLNKQLDWGQQSFDMQKDLYQRQKKRDIWRRHLNF
jgi:hypothetical protein